MTKTTTRYFDRCDASHGLYFEATALVHHSQSAFQDIKIIDTEMHGKVMLLDDVTMLTESTHYVYHEHMVHIPMSCVEAPRSALVIGGGDGGSVTELVKYPDLERVVLAELDGDVVEVSRKYLPELTEGLDDPRVEIRIGDGAAYLADNPNSFDIVIIDSTDICEDGHEHAENASPLATPQFYADLKAALTPKGVAMQMLGSPTFYRTGMRGVFARLTETWPQFRPVLMPCPFYISGDWCAGLLTETGDLTPRTHHGLTAPLRYFNGEVAKAAMALPNDVRALMPSA